MDFPSLFQALVPLVERNEMELIIATMGSLRTARNRAFFEKKSKNSQGILAKAEATVHSFRNVVINSSPIECDSEGGMGDAPDSC